MASPQAIAEVKGRFLEECRAVQARGGSLIYPTGETQTAFRGKWDFEWQLGYDLKEPIVLPKGTRLLTIVHYDNSANNKFNPDPKQDVVWGDQNWDEMQSSFLGFLIDSNTDISKVLKASGPSLLPRGKAGPALSVLQLPR